MTKVIKLSADADDKTALRGAGVSLMVMFGSHVTGNRHPGSDIDIGVLFKDLKQKEADPVDVYGTLSDVLARIFPGKRLDIVYLHEAPLSLRFRAAMEGELLYAESPTLAADFKEYAMKMYFDFKPVEEEFKQVIFG
ncbi:MAG: nucleotidyltransferase domain-containing protein [bacterium]|nr:nucleotidyltransferase domain-containing protein [bacterium]MDZ4341437.1 nucleotidyltransferase domain-containing protein [Candidatus Binatia bacterium]